MGRIRILSDHVANKIAAGEVVERPASVAKELLENALDAGASEIRIDVEHAGRKLIRIQDDGCGMLRDDALLAFERHATSKLSDVKDLLSIETLGFRGEALPSIASVSRLLLETQSRDERTGTAVGINGGKLLRCDEIARPIGTTIAVRDLFFNVPARKKFLRSDQTELAHIGSLVTHYSLGHIGKRFELFHEGRELLNVTPVENVRDRAFQVFGSELVSDLIDIKPRMFELRLPPPCVPFRSRDESPQEPQEAETAQFSLEGLVSGPHVQKLNRNSVFLFVNGRLIRDKVLLHAVQAAYYNLVPSGCYPFALLFLNCDASEVDVNVHPSKTEVRFRHSSIVHDFVRDGVRDSLMESRPASSIPFATSPVITRETYRESSSPPLSNHQAAGQQRAAELPYSEFTAVMEAMALDPPMGEVKHPAEQELMDRNGELPEIRSTTPPSPPWPSTERPPLAPVASVSRPGRHVPDTHGALGHLPPDWERVETLAALPDLRPLG